MPAASTHKLSVQVLDFESLGLLIQLARLLCDFCSSGQRFAHSFLQIPPRDGHPCRPANGSPCRVRRRLSLPSKNALPGAPIKKRPRGPLYATASAAGRSTITTPSSSSNSVSITLIISLFFVGTSLPM